MGEAIYLLPKLSTHIFLQFFCETVKSRLQMYQNKGINLIFFILFEVVGTSIPFNTSLDFATLSNFKKAFIRLWRAAFWAIKRKYNINANLVCTIEQPHDKASSSVKMNTSMGEWFKTMILSVTHTFQCLSDTG